MKTYIAEELQKNKVTEINDFIKHYLELSNKTKLILGLSGGVDSAVVYALSVGAIGVDNVMVYSMPYGNNAIKKSTNDAIALANYFGSSLNGIIDIKNVVDNFYSDYTVVSPYRLGNIMARVRMTYLYDKAMANDGLVLNTCNLSEDMVGYATKYGDGAGDLAPIAHLTKTEIYELAEYLKIPEDLINRIPSAELWEDQTDEKELGFTYNELDSVISLYLINTEYLLGYDMYVWMHSYVGAKPVSDEVWNAIRDKNFISQHKLMPMPNLIST